MGQVHTTPFRGEQRCVRWRQCLAVRVAVLWIPVFLLVEDSKGGPRSVARRGREQGDDLMPALFSLGQHALLWPFKGAGAG